MCISYFEVEGENAVHAAFGSALLVVLALKIAVVRRWIPADRNLRLVQALIQQPRIEFDLALQDSPEIGVGSGLSTAELRARLR